MIVIAAGFPNVREICHDPYDQRAREFDAWGFERVAWGGQMAVLGPGVKRIVEEAGASFRRYLANNPDASVYGATSAYGQNARRRMSEEEQAGFHSRSLATGAMSVGESMPARSVRGILYARLANLIDGHGATTWRVVAAVMEMLNGERFVPAVPREGNGCAGGILQLYHLFAPLTDTFRMEIKEKGPLTNGSPCAAALPPTLSSRRASDGRSPARSLPCPWKR